VPAWTSADLLSAFQQLLPRGKAWPRDPTSVQAQTLATLMPTFQRLTARGAFLLSDAFPSTTDELLPEWEASLGLPDPCAGESPTIALRQAQVLARFTAGGGQSIAYFTAFAATLGYDITIEQFAPSRFGRTFGSSFGGTAWAFAWQVNAPQFTVATFNFGTGYFGDPFASWGNTVLQCELQRLAPAHTTILFNYSSADFSDDFSGDFG
jgi:uncharacterized protein YmfQ (DUF2313 family)